MTDGSHDERREIRALLEALSHHLKEPVASVRGYADLLLEEHEDDLPERALRYIGEIVEGSRRLHALIGDLLDLTRIAQPEEAMSEVDMGQLIGEAVERQECRNLEAPAQVRIQPNLPVARCRPKQVFHLWDCLISNAFAFRRSNRQLIIEIGGSAGDSEYRFFIKDNGQGAAERGLEKAFGVFERLGKESVPGSTGIGLAIAKAVVDIHGGRIWMESRLGEGTTVTFTLPKEPTSGA